MFELIKNILFAIIVIFVVTWLTSSAGGWKELSEKYKTEDNLPNTFLVTENERITFKSENKAGVISLSDLGIGILDYGLYLSNSSMLFPLTLFVPNLLIPWDDIFYRKIAATESSNEYYTFYLGNPRITRFSISSNIIKKLEQDYGEAIFRNKLGEPD